MLVNRKARDITIFMLLLVSATLLPHVNTRVINGTKKQRALCAFVLASKKKYKKHFSLSANVNHLHFVSSRLGLDPSQNRFHVPMVYHEEYSFPDWPPNHSFPMNKFSRLAHALLHNSKYNNPSSVLPRPLVREEAHFFRPIDINEKSSQLIFDWICGPTEADFYHRFITAQLTREECRRIGFREQTSRPELIRRTLLEVVGTILTAQLAVVYGIATHLAGGTHHAHPSGGAGYTILNDLAITTHVITKPGLNYNVTTGTNDKGDLCTNVKSVTRVLVIDCDVHQGDGTAKFMSVPLLRDKLFTLSLHCASNYPHTKACSTFDVDLPDKMKDDEYMHVLKTNVALALATIQPDLVLYDAGVDIYAQDVLGRLLVTEAGIRRRDRWVLEQCVEAGIPVAGVVGGGYDSDVDALARRHAILHEEASFVWRKHRMWETAPEVPQCLDYHC